MIELTPRYSSEAHTHWCSTCVNGVTHRICCRDLGNIHLSSDEVMRFIDRERSRAKSEGREPRFVVDTSNDSWMDIGLSSVNNGFVLYAENGRYKGVLRGECPELTTEGLCSIEEDGETKPSACSMFEAGGVECKNARQRSHIPNPTEP